MKKHKNAAFFCIGGGLYVLLELLWRGRSHISMFFLGGSCFLMLGRVRRLHLPLPVLVCLGALGVTIGELVTGLLVNRHFTVWDYRRMPLNMMGQICVPYSLLWMPVSLLGMQIHRWIDRAIAR